VKDKRKQEIKEEEEEEKGKVPLASSILDFK
jgi:hypothetical protein